MFDIQLTMHLITAALLLACFSVMVVNWIGVVRYFVYRKRYSCIPIVGGAIGFIGMLVSPFPLLRQLWWLPLLLDYGCLPALVSLAFLLIYRWLRMNAKGK